jgi:hypothetical protein
MQGLEWKQMQNCQGIFYSFIHCCFIFSSTVLAQLLVHVAGIPVYNTCYAYAKLFLEF